MTIDPTKVSFSQAEGLEPRPQQLQLGELPYNAKMGFWNAFYLTDSAARPDDDEIIGDWYQVLMSVHADFFYEGLDTFSGEEYDVHEVYKSYFLDSEFNKVFDLILFIARHPNCPNRFIRGAIATFMAHHLAYVFDYKTRTIFPAVTPEEGQAIVDALVEGVWIGWSASTPDAVISFHQSR